MADWRDVIESRRDAQDTAYMAQTLIGKIEDGDRPPEKYGPIALALMLDAIRLEIRAHAMLLDHTGGAIEKRMR